MKRVVIISDLHCGHLVGLTPPAWHINNDGKLYKIQKELWGFYTQAIDSLKPIDILIVNGDAIDGKGARSGSTEARTADRYEQCKMATECIEYAGAKKIRMTYGTPYHVGQEEDWERVVADNVGAKIESHGFYNVDGVVFDCKHKIGSSSVPHGRGTAIKREKVWNLIWESRKHQPKADVVVRSHVHYFDMDVDSITDAIGIVTPALQGYGSKYGARQCSGTVDIGIVYFDVENGDSGWPGYIKADLPQQCAKLEYL
jgi:hypothetical protein